MIQLKEITEENLIGIIMLDVHDDQKDQVDSNAFSICEGTYSNKSWFRGIFFNETPVGFVMLTVEEEKGLYGLWRLMIDKKHQGKGYGKEAMLQVIDYVKTLPNASEIATSYVIKEENGADGFYKNLGFIDTGVKTDKESGNEIIMRLPL